MNTEEKTLARILFKSKCQSADGQKFEDIFTAIMNHAESDFQQIKPWGNIGDRKNDGYIKTKGIFYQVFAPEEIGKSYVAIINKIKEDFAGLLENWNPVKEFYFVVNDKYKGVNADCEKTLQEIKEAHSLEKSAFLTAKDLENLLFGLDDDIILSVAGYLPDPGKIQNLDYSILNEVIKHIMQSSIADSTDGTTEVPDWDKKIKFNELGNLAESYLTRGYHQIGSLEKYLKNEGKFLASALRDKLFNIYEEKRKEGVNGDDLFWGIVNEASPNEETQYQIAVIVIMAKYFESCDIFEEPVEEQ